MPEQPNIILFDGHCNLCNGVVQFIIKRDPKITFHFAALQSEAGQRILQRFELPVDSMDSFVFVQGRSCYFKSAAALRVARELTGLWPMLYALIIVPRSIRDLLYDVVAKRRYRWFGRRDTCMAPTPSLRKRFLD